MFFTAFVTGLDTDSISKKPAALDAIDFAQANFLFSRSVSGAARIAAGLTAVESTSEAVVVNNAPFFAANSNPFLKNLLVYIGCTFISIHYTMLIMKITEFLKKELTGWKQAEALWLAAVIFIILINSVILKDSPIAVISAVCGILYTVIAGKGRRSCYIFGLAGSGCYSYLAFHNALYGNLALYLFYYIPMEIAGFFSWGNHLKKNKSEIIKTKLSLKRRIVLSLISITGSLITIIILWFMNDKAPISDGITAFLSIVGMYLTVKRCIEQWIIWMIVNALSLFMWLFLVIQGAKTFSTVIMWAVYLALSFYFYAEWKKEIA